MNSPVYSPMSAPGRLIAASKLPQRKEKCYLPPSDETKAAAKDMDTCLVFKTYQTTLVFFDREMVIKEVMKIIGLERKFIVVKRISGDEHLLWLETKENCDLIMAGHRTMFVSSVRCEFSRWHADIGSQMNCVTHRVWLEFYNVPAHYYIVDTAWCLVSRIGEIVDVDTASWGTDISCMAICVDADGIPELFSKFDLIYDSVYMVECSYRVVFTLPLDEYWFMDFDLEGKSYKEILNEVQVKYTKKKSGQAFESLFHPQFRDFLDWDRKFSDKISHVDVPSSSYSTPVRPNKIRRVEDSTPVERNTPSAGHETSCKARCYLTASEDSLLNQTDCLRCMVVKIDFPVGRNFRFEDIIDVIVMMYGGHGDSYQWKHFTENQILLWLNTKADRDALLGKCEWLMVKGTKVWFKPWSVQLNATTISMRTRVWLEITQIPLHYYQNRHLVVLLSNLGSVAVLDCNRMNYDFTVVAACLETVSDDDFPQIFGLAYDNIYLKDVNIRRIYDLPCSVYKIVDEVTNARNYNSKITECREFISSKKFHKMMDDTYQGEFSAYLKWATTNRYDDPSEFWTTRDYIV